MSYGHFSKDGREYIITRPDTPRPWFNYLFNDQYHALVSQTGGGYSYFMDPKYYRILRYDHIHTDRPGRYLFIRDEKTREVWTPNWQPLRKKLSSWECRQGLSYTTITAKQDGVSAEMTYLVPTDDPVELWIVKLQNKTRVSKQLKVYPFIELISGDAEVEACYRNIVCLYNQARFDQTHEAILSFKHPFKKRHRPGQAFFSTSLKVTGYDTQKEAHYGLYNDVQNPQSIMEGKLGNTECRGEDMVGVLESKVTLAPNASKEFVVVLGFTDQKKDVSKLIKKYKSVSQAKKELVRIKKYWDGVVNRLKVETPDPNFDLMVNTWGKYQLCAITHWRGTSHYHGVEGGLGYRDTAQDSEGLLSLELDVARAKLEKILYYQYQSGHAVSGFSDVEGSWESTQAKGVTHKADVAVWLPYTVVSYIKETGDLGFLKKEVKFHDKGSATVYEHVLRAVRYIYGQRGKHGLPLIGLADWNDAYDHVGVKGEGESVWLAMALCRACRKVKQLAEFIGDHEVAQEMQEKFDKLYKLVNDSGWDGKWYLAAFNDEGLKIGSKGNREGKVPLNSQTWAILGHVVDQERLPQILDAIDHYLDTPYGPALFLPSYTHFNPGIGRVTAFAEGTKENAAVFSHACAFKIVADCVLGRGDKAYETYSKLTPMSPAKQDISRYRVEPYVWAEYVIGPGSKYKYGEGAFTWNTGTAPWMFTAATEWILGVRRDFEGLRIDPCLPRHWRSARIRRPFRGAVYEVTIQNPDGIEKGVKSLKVDGKLVSGNLIHPHSDGKVHKVEVVMGKVTTREAQKKGKRLKERVSAR
jgi:cellobiose phosphorylase